MGLLESIKKYTSYFHDGDITDVYQDDGQIIISMESHRIPPDVMEDHLTTLTNYCTLKGRLHIEGIIKIYKNDDLTEIIEKKFDSGDIYHLEVSDHETLIDVTWRTRGHKSREETDMIEYKIEANTIYWENLPELIDPSDKPIELYQKYFINGKLFNISQVENKIKLLLESNPILEDPSGFALTSDHTLKGNLELTWLKRIIVDGQSRSQLEEVCGQGEVVKLKIGFHRVQLDIKWLNRLDKLVGSSQVMSFDIECGAIDWRPQFTKPKESQNLRKEQE